MGHCAASDAYTKRFDDIIVDIPRKFKCVDTLLYDFTTEESFWHIYDLLEKSEKNGFAREVDFVGYNLA